MSGPKADWVSRRPQRHELMVARKLKDNQGILDQIQAANITSRSYSPGPLLAFVSATISAMDHVERRRLDWGDEEYRKTCFPAFAVVVTCPNRIERRMGAKRLR